MKFDQLCQYLNEDCHTCSVELIEDNIYMAKNFVSGNMVMIEDLPFYDLATLAYYFYMLNVDAPAEYQEFIHVYQNSHQERITEILKNR